MHAFSDCLWRGIPLGNPYGLWQKVDFLIGNVGYRTHDYTVIISRIWKTGSVCSYYCIDEDPSERRRRNVEAKTHNFSRPKMRGGCGSLLFSWDIVAVERLRLLLGIWILPRSLENVTENLQKVQKISKDKTKKWKFWNGFWLSTTIVELSCNQKI